MSYELQQVGSMQERFSRENVPFYPNVESLPQSWTEPVLCYQEVPQRELLSPVIGLDDSLLAEIRERFDTDEWGVVPVGRRDSEHEPLYNVHADKTAIPEVKPHKRVTDQNTISRVLDVYQGGRKDA